MTTLVQDVVLNSVKKYLSSDASAKLDSETIINVIRQMLNNTSLCLSVFSTYDAVLLNKTMSETLMIKLLTSIPSLIEAISQCVSLSKSLKVNENKYIIYAMLLRYLLANEPAFVYSITIDNLTALFDDAYALVCIVPDTIKIAKNIKSSCFTCCSKTEPVN